MGGTGYQSGAPDRRGTITAPQVQTGVQGRRQPSVARNDQHQAALPADQRDVSAQSGAFRVPVMTEHHTSLAAR